MSQPDRGAIHVNRPLTNLSLGTLQDQSVYACYKAFAVVPTQQQGNTYYKYDSDEFHRDVMRERAPGAETVGIGYTPTTDNFFCKLWGLHHDVPDQNRANQDEVLDEDLDATNQLVQAAMIRMEVQWGADYFTTSKWWRDVTGAATSSGSTQVKYWSDTTSDPVGDVELQRKDMLLNAYKKPNKMFMGYEVWSKLKNHPALLDRLKPGQTGLSGKPSEVTLQQAAMLFEVDEIVVSEAVYNTKGEGETAVKNFILGKHVLLAYVNPSPGRFKPSAGYTFVWTGYTGMNRMGYRIKKYRLERNASDRIEIEAAWGNKLVHNGLGTFFSGVVQ